MLVNYFGRLVQGPLIWIAFAVFIVGMFGRLAVLAILSIKDIYRARSNDNDIQQLLLHRIAFLFQAIIHRPFYVFLQLAFHISLVYVPVFLPGHILLLEYYQYNPPAGVENVLSSVWADRLTIGLLCLCGCFLLRYFIAMIDDVVATRSCLLYCIKNYIFQLKGHDKELRYMKFLVGIVAFPFLTGYLQAHGSFEGVPFLDKGIENLHILSAELLLIVGGLQIFNIRIDTEYCTCCGACATRCPTGALKSEERDNERVLNYCNYQCIGCNTCVNTCPENASVFRHCLDFKYIVHVFRRYNKKNAKLTVCKSCNESFISSDQYKRLGNMEVKFGVSLNTSIYCEKCKRRNVVVYLR